ncbi:MAG: hypothetical protein K0R29_1761 [Pseudobdellovibrio sp.]|jgi:hypothetical protein|nr:hypothetical protein [Pseudobdellovibrio sp.]
MKYLISALAVILFFMGADGDAQTRPAQRRTAPPAPAARPLTAARYADAVQDRAFAGCDRYTSVLEGTDNLGAGSVVSGNSNTGSGGGQR